MTHLPEFLIIGAAKSGTTSLYFYLQQHPNIFLPENKEPNFFTFMDKNLSSYQSYGDLIAKKTSITSLSAYEQLFARVPEHKKVGEASTLYLSDPQTPARIKQTIPNVKLIAILRNPIERAYSHFQHFRKDNLEPLSSFMDALKSEPERIRNNWYPSYYYQYSGHYFAQIMNYLSHFPRSQIQIFLYEDLKDTSKLVRDIFTFIGVDPDISTETDAIFNRSGNVRFPKLYQMIRHSSKIKPFIRSLIPARQWNRYKSIWDKFIMASYDPMTPQERRFLKNIYSKDIEKLQDFLQRDLTDWIR